MEKLKTGFIAIDSITGGLPRGAVCQITDHGMATGKTSLALSVSSNVLLRGGNVLYFPIEDVITKRMAENFGVSSERFLVCRTGDDEEIVDIASEIAPDLLIIDSVSSVGVTEDWKYASISSFCRRLTEASPSSSFLLLNQERMHRYKQSHTGDRFLDKWLSISFDLRPLGFIIENACPVGNLVSLSIRMLRPWRPRSTVRMRMNFSSGFPVTENLVLHGLQTGVLTRRGSSVWWGDRNIRDGKFLSSEDIRILEEEIYERQANKG